MKTSLQFKAFAEYYSDHHCCWRVLCALYDCIA